MIGTAVVLMWASGRIPLAAAVIVLARDLALVVGYKLLAPRGFELEVTFLGKLATWVLYAALGFVLVTDEGTGWPLVLPLDRYRAGARRRSAVLRAGAGILECAVSSHGRDAGDQPECKLSS